MVKRTTSWKGFENRQARRWGTKREGPVGITGADFLTDRFAVQCKLWKTIPKKWTDAINNAVDAAKIHQLEKGLDRVFGVALLKKNSQGVPDDKTLVIMYQDDFEELLGINGKGQDQEREED